MPGPIELTIVLILTLGSFFWIFVLIDCLRNEPARGNEKLFWALMIVLTTLIGALLYVTVRRPMRVQQHGK